MFRSAKASVEGEERSVLLAVDRVNVQKKSKKMHSFEEKIPIHIFRE